MNSRNLKLSLLALGFVAFGAVEAQAADINVVNHVQNVIHPYFRASCWAKDFNGGDTGKKEWVFFGGIGANSQFTWTTFEVLLKPKCRNPIIRYTFTVGDEAAPTGKGLQERTTRIDFDVTVPVYTITLSSVPGLTDVTPEQEGDHDGDDDSN